MSFTTMLPRRTIQSSPKRAWCLRLNNFTPEELSSLKEFCETNTVYSILGFEIAPSGTPHVQGYVHLRSKQRLRSVKRGVGSRAHIEASRGTPSENREYCSKDGDFWEYGTLPRGCRTSSGDKVSYFEAAEAFISYMEDETLTVEDYMRKYPRYWLFHGEQMLANYHRSQISPPKRHHVKAIWLYGATGVGKSLMAHRLLPDAYIKDPLTKWWDIYQQQTTCIIDDLGQCHLDVSVYLRWFDPYPLRVEIKGAEVNLSAEFFIITSNYEPSSLFAAQIEPLLRRLTIFEVTHDNHEQTEERLHFTTNLL